jgi:hypothetical protein
VVGVVLNEAGKENSGVGCFLTSPVFAGVDGFCSVLKVGGALGARRARPRSNIAVYRLVEVDESEAKESFRGTGGLAKGVEDRFDGDII